MLLTISLIESFCETLAIRSANAGLYSSKSPRVTLCQIGKITFLPYRSLTNSPLSSCSVQCFPIRNALPNGARITIHQQAKKRLIATAGPSRIGILSDQRDSKELSSDQLSKPEINPGTKAKKKLIAT